MKEKARLSTEWCDNTRNSIFFTKLKLIEYSWTGYVPYSLWDSSFFYERDPVAATLRWNEVTCLNTKTPLEDI